MTFVRKLKLVALDGGFMDRNSVYKFIKEEQYNQYRALNLGMTYLYTYSILKGVGSGVEAKYKNKIKKLQDKLEKQKEKLKLLDENSPEYIKVISYIKEYEEIIKKDREEFEASKENRIHIDENFKEMYINDLYSVLQGQVNFVYKDNMSLVVTRLHKDFKNALKNGLATGDRRVTHYKRNFPLLVRGRDLSVYKDGNEYFIKWIKNIKFKIVTGRKDKDSKRLLAFLEELSNSSNSKKQYKICDSSLEITENALIINLNCNNLVEEEIITEKVKGRVVGVDLGVKIPAYISLNDDIYKHKALGSYESFVKVKIQFKETKHRLSKQVQKCKSGKGMKRKLKALYSFNDKRSKYSQTYNHYLSKEIVKFAVKNKAEQINLELLVAEGFKKNKLLSEWGYYSLQQMIIYKAKKYGIAVKFVDPYNTSITCSRCGNTHREQRISQELFVCSKCNLKINADYNASINIANSKSYVKNVYETKFYKGLKEAAMDSEEN